MAVEEAVVRVGSNDVVCDEMLVGAVSDDSNERLFHEEHHWDRVENDHGRSRKRVFVFVSAAAIVVVSCP